jgi:NADH:ubiquinone oxidoreductase subunit H
MGQWLQQISFYLGLNASTGWHDLWFVVMGGIIFVFFVLPLILVVAYLTLWERKILAWCHYRLGPNRAGWMGLLQPIADAVKLLIKEDIVPVRADWYVWFLAPIVAFAPMVASFVVIPMSNAIVQLNIPGSDFPKLFEKPMIGSDLGVGLLLILSLSSLVVVGIFTAGFGSNNKYSMFGGARSAGQIISYEVPVILTLLTVVLLAGSLSTVNIVKAQRFIAPSQLNRFLQIDYHRSHVNDFNSSVLTDWVALEEFLQLDESERGKTDAEYAKSWTDYKAKSYEKFSGSPKETKDEVYLSAQKLFIDYNNYESTSGSPRLPFVIPLLVGFLVYFLAGVAECNRSPFDLPEGESEIVAGFHTEYSGIKFGLFFLGEYGNMILISSIAVTCFLGGWMGPALDFMAPIANFVGQYLYYFAWFFIKVGILVSTMVWFRATFPRLRVDQLTDFAWKVLLPIAVLNLFVIGYFHFSDWNLRTIAETNWTLWYDNLSRPIRYPAIRMFMLLVFMPILSDILYPYRKVIQPKYLIAQIVFIIGFMGHDVFMLMFGNRVIELVLQWIFYAATIALVGLMVLDYLKAKRAGAVFIAVMQEDESQIEENRSKFGKQSIF